MNHTPTTPAGVTVDETTRAVRFHLAVEALTDSALTSHPDGRPTDFAEHLAAVLAAVTANVGGLEQLLAGRPGSWEAGLVEHLVSGTVGPDLEQLWRHRTRPVIVALHVAELVENRYGLPGIPEARDRVQAQYQAQHDQAVTDEDLDEASQAEEVALDGLDEAWRAAYRAHGQAFTSAVHARAATLTGLTAPVTVHVTDDPDAAWWGTAPDPLNPPWPEPPGTGASPTSPRTWRTATTSPTPSPPRPKAA